MASQAINSNGQTFLQTTVKFCKDKKDNVAKLFIYGVDWTKQLNLIDRHSITAGRIRHTGNIVKLGAGGLCELPGKFEKIREVTNEWIHKRTKENAKKIFWALNDTVSPAIDTVELAKTAGVVNVPEARFSLYKKIGGVSLLIGFGKSARESWKNYRKESKEGAGSTEEQRVNHKVAIRKHVFDCAKAVSYVVLALLICASLFLGVVAPAVAFSAAGTSALVFTILSFYNEEWGKIYPKTNRSVTLSFA